MVPGSRTKKCKASIDYIVPQVPVQLCDGDLFQLYCLFSPDLQYFIDIDPTERTWVVRNTNDDKIHFRIPLTFLTLDTRSLKGMILQARFMAWTSLN